MKKQVEKRHYEFQRYVHKKRWASLWHQVDETLKWQPDKVLEIGPGPGLFKAACGALGLHVETVDLDPALEPDHICSVLDLPFADSSYDIACAYQMLEHLPYEQSMSALSEMSRVARTAVIISLPDAAAAWPYSVYIPGRGSIQFLVRKPWLWRSKHRFDGEHYWEVNKPGFELRRILEDLEQYTGGRCQRTFRVPDFPYHRFFVLAL